MARYPAALWRPIPENATQPPMSATQAILHVSGSESTSLFDWWQQPGNVLESHFHVARDGTVEQYIDTSRSADANYLANLRSDGTGAVSIETQGGDADGEWTPAQLGAIVALLRWVNATHGVPFGLCPTWRSPGIGWHVMFGSPGSWTPVSKVCPGPARIRQVQTVILPRLLDAARNEEDEMALSPELDARLDKQDAVLAAIGRAVGVIGQRVADTERRLLVWRSRDEASDAAEVARDAQEAGAVAGLGKELDALQAAVAALQPAQPAPGA